jgi:hypothetical protein
MLIFIINPIRAKDPETLLRQTINSKIHFPPSASEIQVEGVVFVEFKVKEDGKIEVLNCRSWQWQLQTYVFQTLSEIKVTPDPEFAGKVFTMRFDFKLC